MLYIMENRKRKYYHVPLNTSKIKLKENWEVQAQLNTVWVFTDNSIGLTFPKLKSYQNTEKQKRNTVTETNQTVPRGPLPKQTHVHHFSRRCSETKSIEGHDVKSYSLPFLVNLVWKRPQLITSTYYILK